MLQDAAQVYVAADAPWLLAPAAALTLTVFLIHAVGRARGSVNRAFEAAKIN
jgi:hypothetical protein